MKRHPKPVSWPPLPRGRLIGPVQAARILSVGRTTVQRWIDSGRIQSHRTVGGHRRVELEELVAFARTRGIEVGKGPAYQPRVLIVDDEEDVLVLVTEIIHSQRPDVAVYLARNGFDAGMSVQRHAPHLVFLDIRMPGMDGVEVCRVIKRNPSTSWVRIVGITGLKGVREVERMRQAGAQDVLHKPLDPVMLIEIVDRIVPRPTPPPPPEPRGDNHSGRD